MPWRRLDRRMLLVAPLQDLGRGLIPIVVILFTGFGDPIRTAITGAGALVLVLYGVVRYFTTTYRVTPTQVQIQRGVLSRTTSVAPVDRVRSVDVTAPLLHRLLGLGKVVIGTGRTDSKRDKDLVLDSLGTADADRLRRELLHRAPLTTGTAPAVSMPPGLSGPSPQPGPDRELVRLRYRWLGYAPFTLSGAVTALVIVGFGSRLLDDARVDPTRFALTRAALRSLQRAPIWLDVLQVAVVVLVAVALLSVAGYVLAFAGFRLTRRADGTLHVVRGLLTRRETTLEHRRVRGVELSQTILLRAVRGARLTAVATGLRAERGNERTAAVLVPPAPRGVAAGVGAAIVDDVSALHGPLVRHGRAATQRRFTRALAPAAVVVLVLVGLAALGVVPAWAGATSPALLPLAALVGLDRARSLGHRVGGPLVVTRSGSLVRRRTALAAGGVIGAVVRSSPFQRRQGVVTLHLTTAAGRQAYPLTDLPADVAWQAVRLVLPVPTDPRPPGPRSVSRG